MTERDPRLDAAYREGATDGPRPEIDERIRAAARRAVATGPQSLDARARADLRRSWTTRWRVPVSIAATVVVAVTLSYMVHDEDARTARMDGVPASARPAPAPAPVAPAEKLQTPAPAAAPAPAPVQAPARRDAPATDSANATALPEPIPFPAPSASERRASEDARAPAPAAAGALSKEVERQAPAPSAAPPPEAARIQAAPASAGPPPPAPQAKPASPLRERALADRPAGRLEREAASAVEQKARTPEEWLEDIRRLKAQDRTEEVAKALAEFRQRYPDYKLPADLAQP